MVSLAQGTEELPMEWVLVLSSQWVVAGIGTSPTTTNIDFASQKLCKAAAQMLKEEMSLQIEKVVTHSRAVCIRRK
jgi:hypothetical protein